MQAGKNYDERHEENVMNDKVKGSQFSVPMKHAVRVLSLFFSVVLLYFSQGAPAAASTKDDCIARYLKKAKCQVATYIISETCKCKFDSNCRYPNSKAIECILENIGDVQDNSAAYLMRNSCIQKNLATGQ
jgi:uncharacterized membrane protein